MAASNGENESVNFEGETFGNILPDRWNNIIFIAHSRTFQTFCSLVVEGHSNPADGDWTLWPYFHRLFCDLFIVEICMLMKNFGSLVLLCFILLFSCSTPGSNEKVNDTPVVPPSNDLPQMTVTTADQSAVNLRELKGKAMLILFQPDCDHCQREAQEIRKHLDSFNEYNLYFISADQMPAIEQFAKTYDLVGHANIKFAATTVEKVLSNFGPISAPSVYIYADQKLIKKFNGEVAIDSILQAI